MTTEEPWPERTPEAVIRLWPEGPPNPIAGVGPEVSYRGAIGMATDTAILRNVSDPTLSVYRPAKPNGVGVIVCPSGGWTILTWGHEGTEVVRWLTGQGYTAFLLKHRVRATPSSQAAFEADLTQMIGSIDFTKRGPRAARTMADISSDPASKQAREAAAADGRRALEIVRARAAEWDVDAARVGIMGMSAGGCVAVDVAIDASGPPPAFVAAIYGGDSGRPIPPGAPPLFAVVAHDDALVYRVVEGLHSDWTEADSPAELHVFRRGGHGFGMMKQGLPIDRWTKLLSDWLADLGFA